MHLVLDSNEYILAFGKERDPSSTKLLIQISLQPNRADIVSRADLFPFKVFTADQFLKKHR